MGKVKVKKSDTFIDMTPMSDVMTLLLTFFMLTSTFVKNEPVKVNTPGSVSETKVPENGVLTILVSPEKGPTGKPTGEGQVFLSYDNTNELGQIVDNMGITLTPAQKKTFVAESTFGTPLDKLAAYLSKPAAERGKELPKMGIPLDSIQGQEMTEFQQWVNAARQVNPKVRLAIKSDSDSPYGTVKKVMSELQDMDESHYYMITQLDANKAAQAANQEGDQSMEMMDTGKEGGKQKKMTVRVDFTPMVDMLMLLITFFMLCTSLSKPSTMELTMPSNDKTQKDTQKNEAKESHSITIYIADGDKIFYGNGKPEYDNANWLKPADWSNTPSGIRYVLQHKQVGDPSTGDPVSIPYQDMDIAVKELNRKKQENPKAYPDSIYQADLSAIKTGMINGKKVSTMTVIIKPTDQASYRHLVDILDEMQISYIGTYVIDKLTDQDKALLAKKGIKA